MASDRLPETRLTPSVRRLVTQGGVTRTLAVGRYVPHDWEYVRIVVDWEGEVVVLRLSKVEISG